MATQQFLEVQNRTMWDESEDSENLLDKTKFKKKKGGNENLHKKKNEIQKNKTK